jgi:hypothetical protein
LGDLHFPSRHLAGSNFNASTACFILSPFRRADQQTTPNAGDMQPPRITNDLEFTGGFV